MVMVVVVVIWQLLRLVIDVPEALVFWQDPLGIEVMRWEHDDELTGEDLEIEKR